MSFAPNRPWIVVGCGRMGRTLIRWAKQLDVDIEATWNRTREAASSLPDCTESGSRTWGPLDDALEDVSFERAVLWVTVADEAIPSVASELAPLLSSETPALHTCGSRPAAVMRDAGLPGPVGSLHPLLAITDPERAVDALPDVAWTVEGTPDAVQYATDLLDHVGAHYLELASGERRALYHAGAATAANLLVGLLEAAFEMAEAAGIERDDARDLLLPLAHSSLQNATSDSLTEALSGPLARGDDATIERHLDALDALGDDDLETLYRALTRWTRRELAEAED